MTRYIHLILLVSLVATGACSKDFSWDKPNQSNRSDENSREDSNNQIETAGGLDTVATDQHSAAQVLRIPLATLAEQDANCSPSSLLGGGCRAAIDATCVAKGAIFGFGPVEMAQGQILAVCVTGQSERLTLKLPSCAQVDSLSCRSAARRACINEGFSAGMPLGSSDEDASVACFKGESVLVNQTEWQLLDGIDVEVQDQNEALQMVAANRLCLRRGFQAGHGAEEGNAVTGEAMVSCFGEAKNPKTLDGWWQRVVNGSFKINTATDPQVQIVSNGLNAVRYTRLLPSGIALGRELHPAQDRWSVASYQFKQADGAYKWQEIGRVIDTARLSPSGMFYSAYDPSVAYFAGKHYLAFECAGGGTGPTVGVCMTEIDIYGNPKTAIVVQVTSVLENTDFLSASAPKLFVHRGAFYLAWTQVRLDSATNHFRALTSRAVKLAEGGQAFNLATAPRSFSNQGFLLMAKPDGMADVADIVSTGEWLYVLSALGPSGCVAPLDPIPGCYNLYISRTKNPESGSDELLSGARALAPHHPHEYAFFFRLPDGTMTIAAQYLAVDPTKHIQAYRITPLFP